MAIMLKNVLLVFLAICVAATTIISITLLSSYANNNIVAMSIRYDLEHGSLSFPPVFARNLKTGIDTWDDCVVVEIATYGEKDPIAALTRAHMILRPGSLGPKALEHPCIDINQKIAPLPIRNPREVYDYWRYWWGSAALLNIVVGILGVSLPTYQAALKLITYSLIFSATGLAFFRYRQAALLFFPVAFALIFGFAIPLFGQSIAHAPGLIVGLTLLSFYMAAGVDRASLRSQFVYLFVAGGIGMYFELFNGDVITVLICFALIRFVSICYSGPPRILWKAPAAAYPTTGAIAHLMTAYVTGAVSMVLFRIVLRAILTGQSLLSILSEWHRDLAKWSTGKLLEKDYSNDSWSTWLHRVSGNLDVATYPYIGKYTTIIIYTLCAMVYLSVIILLFINKKQLTVAQKDRVLAAFLIAVVVPLEYCIFAVHDMIHFWMMGRLLSLFFALAASVALLMYRPQICTSIVPVADSVTERGAR
jgi:hypothetical protein